MDAKARVELVCSTLEYLQNVIGASGKADELVKLTTDIVQNAKRLVENAPEHMRTKSTAVLAEFVKAARTIAKDARAVDSQSLQQLSSTKRAVEAVVKELDQWHASRSPNDEIEVALNELLPRQDSSPPGTPATEREKKLLEELKRQKSLLSKKKEPQRAPEQHGYPEDVLHMAASGLIRSVNELVEAASQKSPSKEALLEPMILMSRMVSILMDLVDSLFVSKYPMRTQVHSFWCTLTENVLAYHAQSKTDDLSSLRTICTQAPAMLSAVEVMAERCKERAEDVEVNKKFSIQRNVGLLELDTFGPGRSPGSSPAMGRKRQSPPQPPEKKQEKVEFEICCMICTGVAVDQKTQQPMAKGSELTLMATPTTTIKDVRRDLSERTGIPFDHIQLRFRGDDVLPDDKKVTPSNPVPYFVFNLYEPNEEELKEMKRDLRRKNRLKIEDVQWDKLSNPMAVALFDYEALGDTMEDNNLEFEEGDIIEVIEKSADGWWTGLLDGNTGIFPASFVEEIPEPRTKEERKRLIKRFRNRQFSDPLGYGHATQTQSQTQSITFDDHEEAQKKPAQLQIITNESKRSSSPKLGKVLKKITADVPRSLSPSSTKPPTSTKPSKYQRRVSEPLFSQFEQPRQGPKKKSLFKKKSPPYSVISEEGPSYGVSPKPRSPILSSPTRRKRPTVNESSQEEEKPVTEWKYSQQPPRRPLVRPASSPKLPRVPPPTASSSSPGTKVKRRPPPPVPPPYAATHGRKGLNQLLHRQKTDEVEGEQVKDGESTVPPETPPSPPPPPVESPPLAFTAPEVVEEEKEEEEDTEEDVSPSRVLPSKSMEDLFNDLAEFDATQELLEKHNGVKERGTERDYATIPRNELPANEGKKVTEMEPPAKEDSPPPPFPPRIDITESPSSSPKIRPKSERPPKPQIPTKPKAFSRPQPPPKPVVPNKPRIPPARPVQNGLDRERKSESPQPPPVPPPRTKKPRSLKKSKGGESERQEERTSPKPARHAPPPPPKPKEQKPRQWALLEAAEKPACSSAPVSRTASPEEINSSAALGVGRLSREGSASTNALSRSPVVMRRTHTVVSSDTPEPPFSDDDLEECTGVGKEGILYKEGTSSRDWKARLFQLLDNKIIYFETTSYTGLEGVKPLGQVLVNRMQGAVPLGEKNNFHCFAIKMRYDTSVVLGSHTKTEMDDWVKSINKMIKMAKPRGRGKVYSSSYRTAMKCITYLSEGNRPALDRVFTSVGGNMGRVNRWLDSIDKGEDPELSDMPDAITAVSLLKVLFKQGRLGCLISYPLAKELCELVKSTSPVSVLGAKLEQLPNDSRGLLKQLLRLFSQVLDYSGKNHTDVGDLNRVFGPLVFESVIAMHSEPLLAYLISTCELVIS